MTPTSARKPRLSGDAGPDMRVLLTVEEAAHSLGIGRTRMFELIQRREVETIRVGRLRRVPVDALHAYVAELRDSSSTE